MNFVADVKGYGFWYNHLL